MERVKGIESDSTGFSDRTASIDSATHLNQINLQSCQGQDVTAMSCAGALTVASAAKPEQIASGHRILTEQERGTSEENTSAFPSDLTELTALWPRLAPHIKEGLIAMAKAAMKNS